MTIPATSLAATYLPTRAIRMPSGEFLPAFADRLSQLLTTEYLTSRSQTPR